MMDKRIIELLKRENVGGGQFMDLYNMKVIKNGIVCTITTRISASNNYFVVVNDEQDKT